MALRVVAEIGTKSHSMSRALADTEDLMTMLVEKNHLVDQVLLSIIAALILINFLNSMRILSDLLNVLH